MGLMSPAGVLESLEGILEPQGLCDSGSRGSRIPKRDIEGITPKDEVALMHYYMAYFSFLLSSKICFTMV